MKKSRILVAVVATLMMGFGVANAQTTYSVGVALPQGNFGSKVYASDLALLTPNGTLGGAATGLQIGMKKQFKLPLIGLSFFGTADFIYNQLSDQFKSDVTGDNITYPNYINVPVMAGVNLQLTLIPLLSIYAEAGAGLNARFITKYEGNLNLLNIVSANGKISYDPAFTFAYQVGAGVRVLKMLSVGVNYYVLGAAPVKGDISASTNILNIGGTTKDVTIGELNPGILSLRVGLSF